MVAEYCDYFTINIVIVLPLVNGLLLTDYKFSLTSSLFL